MRRLVYGTLIFAGLCCAQATMLAAQATATITGHVRDPQQHPIRGAMVLIPGSRYRATTDADGAYSIDSVVAGVYALRAAFIGYKPHELAGLRIVAGSKQLEDFILDAAPVTLSAVQIPPALVLRFQLIRPMSTRTTDKAIMPIDSVLHDLFQWSGYELLTQAAITTDMPTPPEWGGTGASAFTQTMMNVDGDAYDLSVRVDTVIPPRVKLTVSLVGLGRTGSVAGRAPAAAEHKALLSSTVTVGFGRTVVLGSTQPTGGRGGMVGTLILAVRPEMKVNGP